MTIVIKQIRGEVSKINAYQTRVRPETRAFGRSGKNISALTKQLISPPYKAYTTEFDVEVPAQNLAKEIYSDGDWQDQKRKLRDMIASNKGSHGEPRLGGPRSKAPVTILVDHSGSFRGDAALRDVATAVYEAARVLDDGQIPFEILGYTTRSWKGGSSRELWASHAKPHHPGRLCDVMYIVYKSFEDNFKDTYENMALMLEPMIRRENIDGEALLWAHSRFEKFGFSNWLCVVISDGIPADDSTILTNPTSLLLEHLEYVRGQLAQMPNVSIKNWFVQTVPVDPGMATPAAEKSEGFSEAFVHDLKDLVFDRLVDQALH